jgi:hypothetical protein
MGKNTLHFLFLFSTAISFGQDILVKRDSSKIEAKVLEIKPTEIKYKYFNYQSGPTLIIDKNDVAYIVYQNGQKEIFTIIPVEPTETVVIYKSTRPAKKIGDYITVNIAAGLVMNENYVNKPRSDYKRLGSLGSPEDERFSQPGKKQMKYGYSIGVNFLAGKSPFCKHIIGINYLNSTGEFNYEHSSGSYNNEAQTWIGYDKAAHYKSTVHFLNLSTGIRFIIYKRLCIDNMIALNIPVRAVNTVNGYETNSKSSHDNYYEETHYFTNEITHDSKVSVTVSFIPRLSYEFKVGQQKLGAFFSYNISYKYNLPWYMAGVSYYPFKKLR